MWSLPKIQNPNSLLVKQNPYYFIQKDIPFLLIDNILNVSSWLFTFISAMPESMLSMVKALSFFLWAIRLLPSPTTSISWITKVLLMILETAEQKRKIFWVWLCPFHDKKSTFNPWNVFLCIIYLKNHCRQFCAEDYGEIWFTLLLYKMDSWMFC